MDYDEIDSWLGAIRIREKKRNLENLKLMAFSNMQTKKHYKHFENSQQKLINEINFGLGLNQIKNEKAVNEFKKMRRDMKFKRG